MSSMRTTGGTRGLRSLRRSRMIALAVTLGVLTTGTISLGATQPAYAVDYPSWEDVKNARANTAEKEAQITRIQTLLAQLQADVAAKDAAAQEAGRLYGEADEAFQEAAFRASELQAQADAAHVTAESSRQQAGQMAAQLARQGGDLSATLFVNAGEADQLLSKLGYASKLTEQSEGLYTKALQEQNTAQSLTDQADVATAIREELKAEAEAAQIAAQAAFDAAQVALAEQQEHQAELEAQLAVLQSAEEVTEAQYAEGERVREEARKEKERLEREAAAARAAAAAAAHSGSSGSGGSSSSGGWISSGSVSSQGWAWPAAGELRSGFGGRIHPVHGDWRFHWGQDVAAGGGTPIYAASAGRVTYAGYNGGFGYFVKIQHANGMATSYAHQSQILVSYGEEVAAGQVIGRVGTTGTSTGNHLHFEVYEHGRAIDPLLYLRGRGVSVG
ncbi:M23 family metallopeptidase [Salinibacterium sp. ZJ454]|uniref:peptidoglycan DD-metalloendopeptidase family protein n=1 Tax=Salinibacterium sp. ZJ454 TaxID=2708339 RepID=UPI0014244E1E|nr:M23 family metallopeptidase [Salinibacterium sp. ZJ454]